MGIMEELLFDFSTSMPRILVSGRTGVVDNVRKLIMVGPDRIIVDTGRFFAVILGQGLAIDRLEEERMLVSGKIQQIEFYEGQTVNTLEGTQHP